MEVALLLGCVHYARRVAIGWDLGIRIWELEFGKIWEVEFGIWDWVVD